MIDYWLAVRDNIAARSRSGATAVPAGNNIRGAAIFKRLEAEIRRMDLEEPAAVDRGKANMLALDILSKRSQDILVGSWLSYGLFRAEGYEGLAVGLGKLRIMVEARWDELFPPSKQEKARACAVEWLLHLAPALAENEPTDADASAVVAACDALEGLARELRAKLVHGQVALNVLSRLLQPYNERATVVIATAAENAARAIEAGVASE
ncbi:type VI secretion system ImpA family N-terminal domain-containing protein [Bradyrhizobium sp. BR 1433]|uniref:type VI secretion system ImpA family N-terminal domain-containing protein n=1 Tax=Bradyrhizobium sp. BR 1433 TaxID=3447967 RepID=UPI003EE73D8E